MVGSFGRWTLRTYECALLPSSAQRRIRRSNLVLARTPGDDADRPGDDAAARAREYGQAVDALALPWPRRVASRPSLDVALAALVAALSLMDVWAPLSFVEPMNHRPLLSVVFVACSAALLWRRRAPLAVLAFVFTSGALLYLAIGAPEALGTFLPPLVAIYAVGRYSEPRTLVLAAPVIVLGTAIHELEDPRFTLSGPAIFFWALLASAWPVGYAFRRRALALEHLRSTRREDIAAERTRIARELHDVVGHGISVVVLQLVAAHGMLDGGDAEAARRRLVATERSARETLAEMRRLLGLLDEDDAALAPQPGLRELERLVAETREAGMPVDLQLRTGGAELPPGLELAAYRIVQEALTNVIKHARPQRAHVLVELVSADLVVEVVDEGEPAPAPFTDGRGVAGIRERVALYDGDVAIGPRPEGGFAVRARFPVREP
jgi:signal transduction histidine kinase